MATSTFAKQFTVDRKMSNSFVKEMSKAAAPTLNPTFRSNLAHPMQDSTLQSKLSTALNK